MKIKDTDSVKYVVVVSRNQKHEFDRYSTALAYALAWEGMWIDVSVVSQDLSFALSCTVTTIKNREATVLKPQYIRG